MEEESIMSSAAAAFMNASRAFASESSLVPATSRRGLRTRFAVRIKVENGWFDAL